jgi:nucleoside-diphosphate-sugar epimerase
MKIGITGGHGFIGQHVIEAAVQRGHHVVVFDHKGRSAPRLELTHNGRDWSDYDIVTAMRGDVRDPTAMCELAAHADGVIHLAACLGTQETIGNPRPAAETNVMGGLNFLEATAQYKIPGTYISVGNWWMTNPYSISKHTIERYIEMYNRERGTRCNIVRGVNAYGPRQSIAPPFGPAKVRKITPAFACRALTGAPIEVYGDGLQVSDMVHVTDVAQALVRALEHAAAGDVFDRAVEVGPVHHSTVVEVAELVIAATERLGHSAVGVEHLPMRPGETPGATVTADTDTLALVDIDPAGLVGLAGGIQSTVAWYAEHWLPGYLAQQKQGAAA